MKFGIKSQNHDHRLRSSNTVCWLLVSVACLSLVFHLWGIKKNLPYAPEDDEPIFVTRAVQIAASGNLNPGWFGNPGSTIMYPLAAIYHTWYAVVYGVSFFHFAPGLKAVFESNFSAFYVLGRLLAITYSISSIPFIYLIGRRAFGERVGLVGALLAALCPIALEYAQMVRTDSAGVWGGMFSLWLILRLLDRPTVWNHIWAGLGIGLSVSTRYFMVVLVLVMLAADAALLFQYHSLSKNSRVIWIASIVGSLTVVATFALSTPYFFLDFATVRENLIYEARTTHFGADGLSPLGNLMYYLTQAIPQSLSWPHALLAVVGAVLVVWKRQLCQILLLAYVVAFLGGISLGTLHWQRWVIQILPVLYLFAAATLFEFAALVAKLLQKPIQHGGLLIVVILISAQPACEMVLFDIRQATTSTQVLAREWILQNLPPGSRIAKERYTAPLDGTNFIVLEQHPLAANHSLEDYRREGYCYLLVSSIRYERYLAWADRYPIEAAFYKRLFSEGHLLQQFVPSLTRGGQVVRIYELDGPCASQSSKFPSLGLS